jgi:hypothetical protein
MKGKIRIKKMTSRIVEVKLAPGVYGIAERDGKSWNLSPSIREDSENVLKALKTAFPNLARNR